MSALPEPRIRHAHPADAAAWIAMRLALWPDELEAVHAAEVARFFTAPGASSGVLPEAVLVAAIPAEPAERLIGFAELSRRAYAEGCATSPVGFLEGWYVAPEYRRRGAGRALVAAAEVWARSQGCREFASDTPLENAVGAVAHQALGFEEVGVLRCFRKNLDSEAAP